MPQALVNEVCEARFLENGAVLLEAVARELDGLAIGASSPCLDGHGHLVDGLAGEQALDTLVAQPVQPGVDLLAHGVAHDTYQPAHAGVPGDPRHGVERRCPVQRDAQAAGQTLGRRHADAHARE